MTAIAGGINDLHIYAQLTTLGVSNIYQTGRDREIEWWFETARLFYCIAYKLTDRLVAWVSHLTILLVLTFTSYVSCVELYRISSLDPRQIDYRTEPLVQWFGCPPQGYLSRHPWSAGGSAGTKFDSRRRQTNDVNIGIRCSPAWHLIQGECEGWR